LRQTALYLTLIVIPTVAYGAVNAYLLKNGAPDEFQRFGSFVIFIAIVFLGLAKTVFDRDPFEKREAVATEVVFLALGTLQWGYGDLFHCWINGNGWQSC
jgi:hypothetical protein